MLVYLKRNYRNRIPQWGNIADVERAVAINCEKIYRIDPASIVLAMPMWESAGDVVHDYSGQGNDGTNHGADWTPQGLSFVTANNDYVVIPDSDEFADASQEMSWSFLTVPGNIENNDSLGYISKYAAVSQGRSWGIRQSSTDGEINVLISSNGDSFDASVSSGLGLTDGVKALVTITYEIDNTVSFYKNRSFVSSDVNTKGSLYNSTTDVFIGRYLTNYNEAIISEVRIHNITLTADQIALQYALPHALYQPVARVSYFFPEEVVEEVVIAAIWHHLNKNIGR